MFVIIKKDIESGNEGILITNDSEKYIKKFIEKFMDTTIVNFNLSIIKNDEKDIEYFVEIENGKYYLIKQYIKIKKGYLWNNLIKIKERILYIKYLQFTQKERQLYSNIVKKSPNKNSNDENIDLFETIEKVNDNNLKKKID